jgi:hypothetical protein
MTSLHHHHQKYIIFCQQRQGSFNSADGGVQPLDDHHYHKAEKELLQFEMFQQSTNPSTFPASGTIVDVSQVRMNKDLSLRLEHFSSV